MSAPPSVRPARAEEICDVAQVLTDAFVDEAGLNYWLRQGAAKQRARERFFDRAVKDAVHPERELWLAEAGGETLGAAIWLAPGKKAYDLSPLKQLALTPLMLSIAGLGGMSRGFALAEKLEALHPHGSHAHLVFLGVATAAQGRGVGSAILKHTLAPLDASGTMAFLETTTPRNVALYERHGFVVSGELNVPGLQLWTMTRQPR
ncbi:GNAT family N-acetyltransferase [Terricaulis sp.]|uniref:GNAT family N-acetyltransferase n=1 Tax=Terricaulis sp. TaxID=2768686 RepID=UPI0037832B00